MTDVLPRGRTDTTRSPAAAAAAGVAGAAAEAMAARVIFGYCDIANAGVRVLAGLSASATDNFYYILPLANGRYHLRCLNVEGDVRAFLASTEACFYLFLYLFRLRWRVYVAQYLMPIPCGSPLSWFASCS
jgi:hypothetical protein